VLAELAAFNAGFSVVKQVITNGGDLANAFGSIQKMVESKETLRAKQKKNENGVFSFLGAKKSNDFEEFMALDKIRETEKELHEYMKIYGRAGLYDDWVRFQAEARKRRIAERKEMEIILAQRWEIFYWCIGFVVLALGCWGIVEYLLYLKDSR
tara:strand:+ start:395 stop:856 length:462 start_codon:yes stop_codon:yes gene_type:complete